MSHLNRPIRAVLMRAASGFLLSASAMAAAAASDEPPSASTARAFRTEPAFDGLDRFLTAPEFHQLDAALSGINVTWLLAALGAISFVVGVAFLVRSRPAHGVATLHINFPEQVDGRFEVSLVRSRGGSRAASKKNPFARSNSLHTRTGVERETQFDALAPGLWVAHVEGRIVAARSGSVLSDVDEFLEFEVLPESVTALRIAIPPIKSHVELRIHWDREPTRELGVSLRGQPDTLRYSGHGVARLRLGLETHTLLIGAGDRVVERTLRIEDYEPLLINVDLATSDGLVFKGCPPAVSSYLQGDFAGAARALQRDGQTDVASVILAQLHQAQGDVEHAAQAFETAGRTMEAAELRRSIHDYRRAGELFERAGAEREAADMFMAAGAWAEAARVYKQLENWPQAAGAFEKAGDRDGWIAALESQGHFLRAAGLAAEDEDRGRSIRLLQQVGPTDLDHGRASELLVLAFEQEGHLDLAANQLERRLELMESGEFSPQLEFHLSELLEEIGHDERALDVLEILRDREPTFPEVATRIEGLRKKLSVSLRPNEAGGFGPPPGATAFVTKARYEILEEIGSGGMGRVYKARDRRLGREVALKRMPEYLRDHPTAVSLFLGEAQAAARMNHPNIVTLYDADQEQGHFFITMELLHGLALNTLLKQHGAFDADDTARLGLQACAGLSYAHDQGIVHRDIKTANLFITKDKSLKIMDFGLAKIVQAVRSSDETVIAGTPLYMAPEQSVGKVVDGRTDLYALGVTLFELSTGRLPFFEGDVSEQHRLAVPPDPSTIVDGYPRALADLILGMLAKKPEDRPSSAGDVANALTALMDASPTA